MTRKKAIQKIREGLLTCRKNYSLIALKTGTEVEAMTFDEIELLNEACRDVIPLIVKIGGAEARNDIRQCAELNVGGVLAPMIETVYSLSCFIRTVKDIYSSAKKSVPYLAINLESKTALQNFDVMLETAAFQALDQVTLGRGDLAASMHLNLDDEEVIRHCSAAINKVQNHSKRVSVGGGLTLANMSDLVQKLQPNRFNSRHIVFRNSKRFQKQPAVHLYHALNLEKTIYELLLEIFPGRAEFYLQRIDTLNERAGNFEPSLLQPMAGSKNKVRKLRIKQK